MDTMIWSPSLALGIDKIDQQHKEILDCIQELNDLVEVKDYQKMSEVISHLRTYIEIHFSYEEELMAVSGFSNIEDHKKIHQSFINRIRLFSKEHDRGYDISNELMLELQVWWISHIRQEDTHYASCVRRFIKNKPADSVAQKIRRFFRHTS